MCFPEPTRDPALCALEEILRRYVPEPDRADALLLLEVVRRRAADARFGVRRRGPR